METEDKLLERVIVDSKIMTGKPVVRGTRIPVELILRLLAQGLKDREILEDYPHLVKEDIQATLIYALQNWLVKRKYSQWLKVDRFKTSRR